jgi:hypothetical protein
MLPVAAPAPTCSEKTLTIGLNQQSRTQDQAALESDKILCRHASSLSAKASCRKRSRMDTASCSVSPPSGSSSASNR